MDLEIVWSRFAEKKLESIFDYYKSKAGIKVARKIILGIIDTTINLEHQPQKGQIEELLIERQEEFRYLIYTNYKIIYKINFEEKRILIANVFDTRQNPDKLQETQS